MPSPTFHDCFKLNNLPIHIVRVCRNKSDVEPLFDIENLFRSYCVLLLRGGRQKADNAYKTAE